LIIIFYLYFALILPVKMSKMSGEKFFISIFSLLTLLPVAIFAGNFIYVKSIRFTPAAEIVELETFEASGVPESNSTWFDLSNFTQTRSVTAITLRNDTDHRELALSIKSSGRLTVASRNISVTIEVANENKNVECSDWGEEGIFCNGENLTVKIRGLGYRWAADVDNFTFKMNGGLFGFGKAELIGYEDAEEVLRVNFYTSNYAFAYFRHNPTNRARFIFENGIGDSHAKWINTPMTGLGSSGIVFEFANFTETSLGGHGSIRYSYGFTGSITLNLQGTLDFNGTVYPVRNEIYVNLDKLQYSDCPIFNSTNILCYVRSGYIHTYIPLNSDKTLWKTFPEVFVFEISGRKATLTAGERSAEDIFRISDIDVTDFKFS